MSAGFERGRGEGEGKGELSSHACAGICITWTGEGSRSVLPSGGLLVVEEWINSTVHWLRPLAKMPSAATTHIDRS